MDGPSRRELLLAGLAAAPLRALAMMPQTFDSRRPAPGARHFSSPAVEAAIVRAKSRIADPELAWLFENCFPNTLDTTVTYSERDGKPDTYVITGDIDAMWLRDSSAQVWPYLPLAREDDALRKLLAGVVRRQSRNILLDPYANAFFDDPSRESEWKHDQTEMRPGVHERKWEIDSLCYPLRLGYGYWKTTGDESPFDAEWESAADAIVRTFREQQRKDGPGPYAFYRPGASPEGGPGNPIAPTGLIFSRFRPSDDATDYGFLIPSNLFAVVSLHQMAEILATVRHQPAKALAARELADEVENALKVHAIKEADGLGPVYAYEVDGLGHYSMMDDANVPSLLGLPYLGAVSAGDMIYQNTRRLVWSPKNPWFFTGRYEGIGGPHIGPDWIWPMSHILRGLTATDPAEVKEVLRVLKATHGGTGFMHESFHKDDPARYTRHWFAWANTLFGELVLHALDRYPSLVEKG